LPRAGRLDSRRAGAEFFGVGTAPETTEHILLVDCRDCPGLVHAITGVLFRAGANVISNNEYVDAETQRFFMRTACDGLADEASVKAEIQRLLPAGAVVQIREAAPRRVVVLVSREHHCVADLLVRHAYGELGAELLAVVSNHDNLRSLAEKFSVPFHHVPYGSLTREEHEDALQALIAPMRPDYIVLAKYMRILSPRFVATWPNRIINIHHSFLPAFPGADPYARARERGVKLIGATAHYVTEQLDDGPIIDQEVVRVDHRQRARDLERVGRDVERQVLARAVALHLDDRVIVDGRRTIVF
jgi:formyltetrahydrofolate deformylase